MVFGTVPSLHPSTFLENVFHTCLSTFLLHSSTLKENILLASFQTSESITSISDQGTCIDIVNRQGQKYGGRNYRAGLEDHLS